MIARVALLVSRLDLSGSIREAKAVFNGLSELGDSVEFISMYNSVGDHGVFTNTSSIAQKVFYRKISQLKSIFDKGNLSDPRLPVIILFSMQADAMAFTKTNQLKTIFSNALKMFLARKFSRRGEFAWS
jgi:hypothetical protein